MNLTDSNRYFDLSKWFLARDAYMDFEGLADSTGIEELAKKYSVVADDEARPLLQTMMVHYIFTCRDTSGEDPSEGNMMEVAAALMMFISVRYLMKESAK